MPDENQPQPTQPVPPPAPAPQAAPYTGTSYPDPAPAPRPKSKKGLIIGLAIGIPMLLLLIAAGFVALIALPPLQSIGAADGFMKDMVAGDVDAAVIATGDESDRSFLTASSAKVKGNTYKLADSKYNGDGESYYLFTLSGGEQKSARVATKMDGGKRLVSGFVYSTNQLSLLPGVTSNETKTTDKTDSDTSACFAPSDYSHALGYANTLTFNETSPYTTNVHFQSDSLQYDSDGVANGNIGTVASIVSDNPGKDYAIHIYGSVATTAAADASFAGQRAEKVKSALVAKGVDTGKVTIDAPQNISSMGDMTNETAKQMARSVVIKFAPACTTDSGSRSGR